jgi:hypothetical protein
MNVTITFLDKVSKEHWAATWNLATCNRWLGYFMTTIQMHIYRPITLNQMRRWSRVIQWDLEVYDHSVSEDSASISLTSELRRLSPDIMAPNGPAGPTQYVKLVWSMGTRIVGRGTPKQLPVAFYPSNIEYALLCEWMWASVIRKRRSCRLKYGTDLKMLSGKIKKSHLRNG